MTKPFTPLIKSVRLPCRIGVCQGYLIEDKKGARKSAVMLQCDTCHGWAYIPRPMAERLGQEKP